VSVSQVERMRDRLAHRGPDGSGTWDGGNVILAHRRLAVLDPTPAGAQPMTSADGRWIVSYNGELYDDSAIRRRLQAEGHVPGGFRTKCDTETVVEALAAWGSAAFDQFRGMYAIAAYDTHEHRLVLARDPLGIKPLFWWCDGTELVAASEPTAILEHPAIEARPDLGAVSGYLGSLRTTLGERTMFDGIFTLLPGSRLEIGLDRPALAPMVSQMPPGPPVDPSLGGKVVAEQLLGVLEDSVTRHLRSDVPLCALLSGGIDSAALVELARGRAKSLRTYVAGAPSDDGDIEHARELADLWGLRHDEAIITQPRFLDGWANLIDRTGLPLTTPNEVAIHAVSARLASDGCVVTLSGEGADELLAGYGDVMKAARLFEAKRDPNESRANFHLDSSAWIPSTRKVGLFRRDVWQALDADVEVGECAHQMLEACTAEAGPEADPLDAHLRYLRRVNLTALLERLDRTTQQASVEGRTPFADIEVAHFCESLPIGTKYGRPHGLSGGIGVMTQPTTKLILREAMRKRLPETVLHRPKASFPLPFQEWLVGQGDALRQSEFASALFRERAIERASADPVGNWGSFWPMANLARWGDRWFA
jgi:asparagine synthase (glutamine-hydrolysing)